MVITAGVHAGVLNYHHHLGVSGSCLCRFDFAKFQENSSPISSRRRYLYRFIPRPARFLPS
jgi:hypothetical protein